MKRLLEKLATQIFAGKSPSQTFIETLSRYLTPVYTKAPPIDAILSQRSQSAFDIYKRMGPNETAKKLVYVLLCLSDKSSDLENDVRLFIKKAALGFSVQHFRSGEISALKNKIAYHLYNVVYHIHLNSLIYKKLKLEAESPRSQTHQHFLEKTSAILKEYESTVLEAEYDFLKFYSKMYPVYAKLSEAVRINDILSERSYLISAVKQSENLQDQTIKNADLSFLDSGREICNATFKELMQYGDIVYKVYNDCTRQYFLTGTFSDNYSEYFIKDHLVDYGMVPPFLNFNTAEKIAYIGKCVCFLKSIGQFTYPETIIDSIKALDLSRKSSTGRISDILKFINNKIKGDFIDKYRIFNFIDYLYDTFMFGRVDFIEHLFSSLKDSCKMSRNSVLCILDDSLSYSFPDSKFNALIDIYLKSEPADPSSTQNTALTEGFSLYCKMEYPMSIIFEQEFVLKLVYIFKFLWKLKKIEHLTRRARSLKYVALVYKLMHYVFYEAIACFNNIEWEDKGLSLDILKTTINRRLDTIMDKLFINTHSKRIEYLLYYMEKAFITVGKGGLFDEEEIQRGLREFIEYAGERLENTYLFDIKNFLN